MRVFLDALRPAPEGWVQVQTAQEAIELLAAGGVEEISLDDDLGDNGGSGFAVLNWIRDRLLLDRTAPPVICIHAEHPDNRRAMEDKVESILRIAAECRVYRIPCRTIYTPEIEATRKTPFSADNPWQFSSLIPYGWSIGPGWREEVQQVIEFVSRNLVRSIDRRIFSWLQVKEKWGRLEMYCRLAIELSPDTIFSDERDAFDGWEALKSIAGDRLVIQGENAQLAIPEDVCRQILERVQEASRRCETICEICGQPGTLIQEDWHRVRCQEHFHGGWDHA